VVKPSKNAKALAKILSYALGCRPDEFGLVADPDGYIYIKEMLKALRQEDGWRHLRMANLNEVAATITPCPIEIETDRIRAVVRDRLPRAVIPRSMPKLLHIPVRSRAYPTAVEKGLHSGRRPHLILSSDKEMALKLGLRLDNEPVILTVQVAKSQDKGVDFKQYGDTLFLADEIPVNTFSGPPLPKERPAAGKARKPLLPERNPTPGSYYLEFSTESAAHSLKSREKRRKKEAERKKARKQARKHKSRQQSH
jgi:putative RNA 2'-phosphotransferase